MRLAGPKVGDSRTPEGPGVKFIGKDAETKEPEIFSQIVNLVAELFLTNRELALNEVRDVLKAGGRFYYVLDRDTVIGFSGFQPDAETGPTGARELRRGVGFTISGVHPDHRKKGVYESLNRERLDGVIELRAAFFYMSTQNPIVEWSMKRLLDNYVKTKRIKGYSLVRKPTINKFERPYTRENPGKSGDSEIDSAYGALDIEKGEMFQLEFTIQYP